MTPARFPHSDTPGSTLGCQLPRAYRRLLRPSSALDAKASTTCPSQLVTHTTNPTHPHQQNNQQNNQNKRGRTGLAVHTTRHKEPHTHTGQSPAQVRKTSSHPPHREQLHDARVHYPDLKQQPHTRTHTHTSHTCTRRPRARTKTTTGGMGVEAPGCAPDSSEPQQCAPTGPDPSDERPRTGGEMSMFHS
jgi:hypothetical protein